MILTAHEASTVHQTAENLNGHVSIEFESALRRDRGVTVEFHTNDGVTVAEFNGFMVSAQEQYPTRASFAEAYGVAV